MWKKGKAVLAVLLACILALAAIPLSGCKTEEEGERVLTIGIPQSSTIKSYTTDNGFTDYLEEKLGVKLKFEFFSGTAGEYRQQLALMCSANQKLPDVLIGMDLGHYLMNQYGEDGYFIDLTDLIENYAPNYKKALAELRENAPEVADYASEKVKHTETGEIFGMPRIMPIASDSLQSLMHINKNWLDKLGLEMPTNLKELEEVLRAFKENDPNGNGTKDEFGMLGGGVRDYIINAFVYWDSGTFNITDGKVWDPVYTQEFRDALIYGNKLVKENLYDKMSFTATSNQDLKNIISPAGQPSKVGAFCGLSTIMTNVNSPAIGEFAVMPALADETGKGGYLVVEEQLVGWTGFITKDCQNPELAMQFMDLFYEDETVSRQRHGVKDVDWEYYDGHNGSGTKSYVRQINSEAFFGGNSTWGANMLGICTDYNYLTVSENAATDRIKETQRLVKETWDYIHNAREAEERCIYLVYTPEEYEVREEKLGTMNSYLSSSITKFFHGEMDPSDDEQWNTFLSTLDRLGRKELMEIAQKAYDRK